MDLPNLPFAAFWHLREPKPPYTSLVHGHKLRLERGRAAQRTSGPFGGGVYLDGSSNLYIPNSALGNLDMADTQEVTVVAWAKRHDAPKDKAWCIAGVWDEWGASRQYALFHDLGIVGGQNRPYLHVSRPGGATKGYKFCIDGAATERTATMSGALLRCVGGTYDGKYAKAYLDGITDRYEKVNITLDKLNGDPAPVVDRNPYYYPLGLNPKTKSPFRVNRSTDTGGTVPCTIGALAVLRRALTDDEMLGLYHFAGGA